MLKKGILIIFRANIISLIFNLIANFLLPKYLTVGAYADIKSFQLYITYIGLLHFGYADGMYLRYGGKSRFSIETNELESDIVTMRIFQVAVTIASVIASLFFGDYVWLAFALSVLPLNMTSYYKLLYQATGEFEKYGNITNITSIVTFVLNMMLLFGAAVRDTGKPYIVIYVALYIVLWMYMEKKICIEYSLGEIHSLFSLEKMKTNVKNGLLLTLGNLSNAFFTGMDRWFVKFLMNTIAFAQYSFAVSVENFLNVAVTPISVTLYNYFCINTDKESKKKMLGYVIIFSVILPACAFPAKYIVELILNDYLDSMNVLFYLFAAQIYATINKCIYVNLYKAERQQGKYFFRLIFALLIGFLTNLIFWLWLKTMLSFAIATLLSNIAWLLMSINDFKEICPSFNQIIFIILETISFLLCGINLNSVMGLLTYIVLTVVLALIFTKSELKKVICEIRSSAL